MSTIELRNRILEKISSITDESILEEIAQFVEKELEMEAHYRLTRLEREAIEKGLSDAMNGELYSSEEAEHLMKEWLQK